MATWAIPVTWEVGAIIYVEADTLDEAIDIARDDEGVIPCPSDSDYVSGSWRVSEEDEDAIREYYNDGQEDS